MPYGFLKLYEFRSYFKLRFKILGGFFESKFLTLYILSK